MPQASSSSSRLRIIQEESSHLWRYVTRHDTQNTRHVFFTISLCSWSITTAKIDHIHSSLRRSTEATRGWQLSWTTSSHLDDQLNPSLQWYLEWPSTYWTEYFAEECEPPTLRFPSHWSSTAWWSPHSFSSNWQGWYQHSWKDDTWWDQQLTTTSTCAQNEVFSSLRKYDTRQQKGLWEVVIDRKPQTWPPSWFCFSYVPRLVRCISLNATGGTHRTPHPTRTLAHFSGPSVLSTPIAQSSTPWAFATSMARSCRKSPSASARWRELGRMVDSAPNTLSESARRITSVNSMLLWLQDDHHRGMLQAAQVYHQMRGRSSEMHLDQANVWYHFEIERLYGAVSVRATIVGYPLDGLPCCVHQGQPLLDFPCPCKDWAIKDHFSNSSINLCWQQHRGSVCRANCREFLYGHRSLARVPSEWLPTRDVFESCTIRSSQVRCRSSFSPSLSVCAL